ncbi:MAG: aldo/keto reductase [bacterium]
MPIHPVNNGRRRFLKLSALLGLAGFLGNQHVVAGNNTKVHSRLIPSSGEAIPVIGLGSSRTFNVGNDPLALERSKQVIEAFLAQGGTLIDSSPMYGSSQATIGYALDKLAGKERVFSADKVWISDAAEGPAQIEQSRQRWGVPMFDLLQIHNLVSWQEHLETLREMKADGKLKYIGITTSHGRRHDELEDILLSEPIDFVQFSYSATNREAERRLLPIAREKGIAVIVNRAFQRGDLIDRVKRHPLPGWADEIDCDNWAQVLLKFVTSHPAVTCVIPATTRVDHLTENMAAMTGKLPDQSMREQIARHIVQL